MGGGSGFEEEKVSGPFGDGEWEIYWRSGTIFVAVRDPEDEWSVVTVQRGGAQHLRDFARNLERAAEQLERP